MKKLIIYAVLALFLVGAMAPVANAEPATALTQVKITAVEADAAGNWIPTDGKSSFNVYRIKPKN